MYQTMKHLSQKLEYPELMYNQEHHLHLRAAILTVTYGYFDGGYDIMSFIRRRSGSSWINIEEFRRRSGSSWVITNNVRRRSGSSWVNVMQGINMTSIGTRSAKEGVFYGYLSGESGSITPTTIFGDSIQRIEWLSTTDNEILSIGIENSSLTETYLSGCSFQGFGYAARSSFGDLSGIPTYSFDFGSSLPTSGSARIYFYGG